jgi:putative membrane protein
MWRSTQIYFTTILCLAVGLSVGVAVAQKSATKVSSADKTFIQEAAQGGAAEVQLGRLAAQRGSSEQVKQFGQRMVDDHSRANDQLKALAQNKGIDVPSGLSAKDQAFASKLEKLSGPQFR